MGTRKQGRHWPARGARESASTGRHGGHGVPALVCTGGTECRPKAEGRHWPALGARSAGLPAEGRRWPECARRSDQCAVHGARLSSMECAPYIYCYWYMNINSSQKSASETLLVTCCLLPSTRFFCARQLRMRLTCQERQELRSVKRCWGGREWQGCNSLAAAQTS